MKRIQYLSIIATLLLPVALTACNSSSAKKTTMEPSTSSGAETRTVGGALMETPQEDPEVVAVDEDGETYEAAVAADGSFALALPANAEVALYLREAGVDTLEDAISLVYPRISGETSRTFMLGAEAFTFDLGEVHVGTYGALDIGLGGLDGLDEFLNGSLGACGSGLCVDDAAAEACGRANGLLSGAELAFDINVAVNAALNDALGGLPSWDAAVTSEEMVAVPSFNPPFDFGACADLFDGVDTDGDGIDDDMGALVDDLESEYGDIGTWDADTWGGGTVSEGNDYICGDSDTCDASCTDGGDDACNVECRPGSDCAATCQPGQSCEFNCSPGATCDFDCEDGDCTVTGAHDGCACSGDCFGTCGGSAGVGTEACVAACGDPLGANYGACVAACE